MAFASFSKNSSGTVYVSTVTVMYTMYIVETENDCHKLSLAFNFAIVGNVSFIKVCVF